MFPAAGLVRCSLERKALFVKLLQDFGMGSYAPREVSLQGPLFNDFLWESLSYITQVALRRTAANGTDAVCFTQSTFRLSQFTLPILAKIPKSSLCVGCASYVSD